MRNLLAILTIPILAAICTAQDGDKGKLNPTPDPNAAFKVYIPKDLEDCFVELKKMLHPALINDMRLKSEDDMIKYHHSLGTWIRNNWGLWAGGRLSKYFYQLGIKHPDDMSGIILTSFWRHLHSQPIKLDEQIEYYKKYWRDLEENEASITPVSKTAMNTPLKAYGGKSIKLGDYAGQVVVLSWWSIFCDLLSQCDDVLPHLVQVKTEFASRGVEVIGLTGIYPPNQLKYRRLVRKAINKYKINFPIVWADESFSNDIAEYDKFGYSSLPQVFVISRDGRVVKRIRGFNATALRNAVENAIKDIHCERPTRVKLREELGQPVNCLSQTRNVECFDNKLEPIRVQFSQSGIAENIYLYTSCVGIHRLKEQLNQIVPEKVRGKYHKRVDLSLPGSCKSVHEEEYECVKIKYSQENCMGCAPASITVVWK